MAIVADGKTLGVIRADLYTGLNFRQSTVFGHMSVDM